MDWELVRAARKRRALAEKHSKGGGRGKNTEVNMSRVGS